jgi:hypothetical protein
LAGPIVVLGAAVLFVGCSGEEHVPLKKVDFMYDVKDKKLEDLPKNVQGGKGSSAGMKRDPSGMHPGG